ncbi:MAG: hypothetical protein KGL39_02880 [Patescibacteria group bacterium]|nr:hypothetical protein [Patescibacteria group bacterium]
MAKKLKKKKSGHSAPKAQTTMPLTGKGVEELRIPELDEALDKLIADDKVLSEAKEAIADSKKAVVEIMHAHQDELVKEVNGGVSYSYDQRLFKLAPTGEKLTVKVIHDKNLGGEED